MIAIALAALTVLATLSGGLLALKSRDRFHLVLGLSAGLLLGLVAFDLLPEIFDTNKDSVANVPQVSIALLLGFLILHFTEQFFGSHEPANSKYQHDHTHAFEIAGTVGAFAMAGHIFLDGVALGLSFKVDTKLGIAVFLAMVVHAFSDGLNTVALLVKLGQWKERGKFLLGIDALSRIGGATLGTTLAISDSAISLYLAAFAGIVIYLATSHILPEAHSNHPTRLTLLATLSGVLVMWLLVANL